MGTFFDKSEIPIKCANCSHVTPQKVSWIKTNSEFVCSNCGTTIRLQAEELLRGLDDAEGLINKFKSDISKMGPIKL